MEEFSFSRSQGSCGKFGDAFTRIFCKKAHLSGKDDASYKKTDVKALAKEYDVSVTKLAGGEKLALGGATGEIWLPDKTDYEKENNNSVVMRLVYGDTACLFTGDMEKGQSSYQKIEKFLQIF